MKIQNMFQKDINRDINGVVKVSQSDQHSLEQELSEYIITKELRRHFDTFFENYTKAIDYPTDKIGVWISGFFGSGKSHFLKMLSYLLSNKEVAGKHAFDYFADKFDDPMTFANVQKSVRIPTESILFNIDIEGPINKDIGELKEGRRQFTEDEWLSVMLRSCGYEPDTLSEREKWLLLTRMIPLVENNFNLCELGPRSTGKSHIYKEISPNSILVSGGQTTVANLFYNMGRKTVGLVGLWDCVAFDEVAGINFKDKDGSRISGAVSTTTKDYIVNYQDLQGLGMTEKLTLPTVIAICSIALGKPALSSLAVLGEISIAGSILKVDELANALQVCLDSGAKKVLLPITSAADLGTVPPELVGCFNLIFYQSPEDAVFKALGVE